MKKTLAAILAFSMVLSISSCNKSDNSDVSESEITSSVTDETNAEESENNETESDTESESETEGAETEAKPQIDESKLSYDFSGLDSGKCMTMLTSGKYHVLIKYVIMGESMYQDLYFCDGSMLMTTDYMGTAYTMLYKDKTQYTIFEDIYYTTPAGELFGSGDMFEKFAYYESGTTELEGVTYKYDEYYQETTQALTKVLMKEDNTVFAFVSGEQVMYIEKYDQDFDPAQVIALSENAKEVSAEEFNTQLMNKLAGETAAESENADENSADTENEADMEAES